MFSFLAQTFLLGLKNLHLHKLRSTLTALGIIIGVLAFVVIVAIGEGAKQDALERVKQLGSQNVVIQSKPPPESTDASSKTQRILEYGLKREDLKRLEEIPGLSAIVPVRDTEQKVVYGDMRASAEAIAVGLYRPADESQRPVQFFDVFPRTLQRGRLLDPLDYNEDNPKPVCVMGALAAQQLFPYADPIGKNIQVGGSRSGVVVLTVVGVLERTGLRPGGFINRDVDQDIYFPLPISERTFHDSIVKQMAGSMETKRIQLSEIIWLQVRERDEVERLAKVAENTVGIMHPAPVDFEVKAPIEILRDAERQNRMFNFIIGGISGFSLIVGGIGIMNIMLASVTERTREIGIRPALGAKRKHITVQFLIETTVISLSGGMIGIVLGAGCAVLLPWAVNQFSPQHYPTKIATWSVAVSFIFSGMIGIFFGLYPAVVAARMNPIDALRHE